MPLNHTWPQTIVLTRWGRSTAVTQDVTRVMTEEMKERGFDWAFFLIVWFLQSDYFWGQTLGHFRIRISICDKENIWEEWGLMKAGVTEAATCFSFQIFHKKKLLQLQYHYYYYHFYYLFFVNNNNQPEKISI